MMRSELPSLRRGERLRIVLLMLCLLLLGIFIVALILLLAAGAICTTIESKKWIKAQEAKDAQPDNAPDHPA